MCEPGSTIFNIDAAPFTSPYTADQNAGVLSLSAQPSHPAMHDTAPSCKECLTGGVRRVVNVCIPVQVDPATSQRSPSGALHPQTTRPEHTGADAAVTFTPTSFVYNYVCFPALPYRVHTWVDR